MSVDVDKVTVYDLQDMENFSIPPRSRLYHLKPYDVGTPFAENLTSYMIRLASDHCISVKTLISEEMFPILRRSRTLKQNANPKVVYIHNTAAVNGNGVFAWDCVNALKKLTLRNDVDFLTMLAWSDIFCLQKMMRRTQAWCSACFEEQKNKGESIHTLLLWSLRSVVVCCRHRRFLQTQCPFKNCQQSIPYFAPQMRTGYCPSCERWLGNLRESTACSEQNINEEKLRWLYWAGDAMGELIQMAPSLTMALTRDVLSLRIDQYVQRTENSTVASFARNVGIEKSAIASWQEKRKLPFLDTFLKLCFQLSTTPFRFLTETTIPDIVSKKPNEIWSKTRETHNLGQLFVYEELRKALEEILVADEFPLPSISDLSQRLGYSARTLRARFPELCHEISARSKQTIQDMKQNKPVQINKKLCNMPLSYEELKQALEDILASNESPFPSLKEIAQRLGYRCQSSLKSPFPEFYSALSARRRKSVMEDNSLGKIARGTKKPGQKLLDDEELKCALESILASNETPPPSVRMVAERLGYRSPMSLRYRFPEMCRAIASRHKKMLLKKQPKRLNDLELSQALEDILNDNETPPSVREIAQGLGYRSASPLKRRCPEIYNAIKFRYQDFYYVKNLRSEVEAFLASNELPPISVNEVAKRLGHPVCSFYSCFPDLCQQLVKRRNDYFQHSDLQNKLEDILRAEECLSMNETARRLGYSKTSLFHHFPDLCRSIVVRYKDYRRNKCFEKKQKMLEKVRQAILDIHSQGLYPSTSRINKLDASLSFALIDPEIHLLWETMLNELGWNK